MLAATLTQGISLLRDWLKRRREASFSALYAALVLEEYARQCSDCVSESETYDDSSGYAGSPQGRLPEKPSYIEEIDWKSLGVDATTQCLSLLVEIDMANQKIAAEFEYVDDDAGVMEVRRSAVDVGLKAFALAAQLRAAHRVEKLRLDKEWNFLIYLRERKRRYQKLAQESAEQEARSDLRLAEAMRDAAKSTDEQP